MADDIVLKIGGKAYGGWKSVSVRRALASLTGSFSLSVTEEKPGQATLPAAQAGDACEVWIGSDLVLTGWVDSRNRQLSARGHTVTIAGRDRTADLVDCSTLGKPTSWKGQKLERIVGDLVKPFGLPLKVKAATGASFPIFAIEPGESVFEAISRACRMRGVMIGTDNGGNVLLFTPSQRLVKGSLELGRNILDIDVRDDAKDRFSQYVVKAQTQGGDDTQPADAAGPKGTAKDAGVARYRPLVLIADEQSSTGGLQTRAKWEATTRSAAAQNVNITVRNWRGDDGTLWENGALIPVTAGYVDVDMTLMIAGTDFTVDEKGQITRLTLSRKEAFTVEPLDEEDPGFDPKKGKKGKGSKIAADLKGKIIEPGFAPK